LTGAPGELTPDQIEVAAAGLAKQNGQYVFVTLAARGILGAAPTGKVEYAPALPVRGEIETWSWLAQKRVHSGSPSRRQWHPAPEIFLLLKDCSCSPFEYI
jgi:hypothetical protein